MTLDHIHSTVLPRIMFKEKKKEKTWSVTVPHASYAIPVKPSHRPGGYFATAHPKLRQFGLSKFGVNNLWILMPVINTDPHL